MGASDAGSGNRVGDGKGTKEDVPVSMGGIAVGVAEAAGKTVTLTVDVEAVCD